MSNRALKLLARPPVALLGSLPVSTVKHIGGGARAAVLTLALSLPQGMLAVPIAVAQVGLLPRVLILLLIGALNTVTIMWVARAVAAFFARYRVVPSLPQLARDRLGSRGESLARAGGAALFFLAFLASLVGLARNLADLTATPAPLWGGCCGLLIMTLVLCRTVLSTRLLAGLGLLNIGLVVVLLIIMLPHAQAMALSTTHERSPLAMVGVSLMLFFAPMLLTPVAQHLLPQGYPPQTLIYGSAAGVAGGALLFGLWSLAVCSVAGGVALAEAGGTAIPILLVAAPTARIPGLLLGLLLLGMTALRCALVLSSLTREPLPEQLTRRRRHLVAQLPAGLGVAIALALLLTNITSFIQLIAIAGVGAASLTSLVIPTMIAHAMSVAGHRGADPERNPQ